MSELSESVGNDTLTACCFESRMAGELSKLLERKGIATTQAPSMQEVALEENRSVNQFAEELLAGNVDISLFFTGVGTRMLFQLLSKRNDFAEIEARLRETTVVARGPKPTAALKEQGITPDVKVANPFTWNETWQALNDNFELAGKRIAVQEYGAADENAYHMLKQAGAEVLSVPIYRWELPTDIGPLESAIQQTIDGQFSILVFTSAQQIRHVLLVAEKLDQKENWLAAANKCVIASIGPTCSAAIVEAGLSVDIEPDPPKLGPLVKQVAEQAANLYKAKQTI